MLKQVQSAPQSLPRRLCFWSLLLVFVALCVWWTTTFHYDPELMRSAIPPYAAVVSEHQNIGERWPAILRHKVLADILEDAGSDDLREALEKPALASWLARLAGSQSLTAYVPEGTPGAPVTGLVIVSWVGRYGQCLRWGLLNSAIRAFEPGRARDRSRIWRMTDDSFPRGYVLSLSACEGIALACLSPDQDAAAYLRARVACRVRAIDRFAVLPDTAPPLIEQAPDRAWGRVPGVRGFSDVRAGLDVSAPDSIQLLISGYQLPVEPHVLRRRDVASMWPLLRDTPTCLAAATTQDVLDMLELVRMPSYIRSAVRGVAAHAAPEGAMFVCMASGDHSGTIRSLRVPSIIGGVRTSAGFDVASATTNILDRLNAEEGKSFIPCRAEINGHSVITIGDAAPGAPGTASLEERPAVAAWRGWLLASSNARALARYLADVAPLGDAGGEELPPMPEWARELTRGSLNAYVWADAGEVGRALRNAAAVYEMYLLLQRPDGYQHTRSRLKSARRILSYATAAGNAVLRVERDERGPLANLRITAATGD